MKGFAVLLIVGVFFAHDGANWLAEGSRFSPAAVFYMLQGIWTALLSALLLALVWAAKPSIWRSLCIAALVISIVEGLQIPACRFFVDDIYALAKSGMNTCDYVTRLPVSAVTISLELIALCVIVGTWFWRSDEA